MTTTENPLHERLAIDDLEMLVCGLTAARSKLSATCATFNMNAPDTLGAIAQLADAEELIRGAERAAESARRILYRLAEQRHGAPIAGDAELE